MWCVVFMSYINIEIGKDVNVRLAGDHLYGK